MGGGIELALACDIRVAAADAQFGFYHMRRGMHFADGGIVRLVNTCGVGIAMELELMGEAITAERAKECHLVNRVVPRGQLMPTVEDIAARILHNPLLALPGIANVAVIGLPDPVVGERVCAVIEPAVGHEPPTLEELRDHLTNRRGMAVWKIPERIEIVTQWPLTATGKVKKYVLRKTIGT